MDGGKKSSEARANGDTYSSSRDSIHLAAGWSEAGVVRCRVTPLDGMFAWRKCDAPLAMLITRQGFCGPCGSAMGRRSGDNTSSHLAVRTLRSTLYPPLPDSFLARHPSSCRHHTHAKINQHPLPPPSVAPPPLLSRSPHAAVLSAPHCPSAHRVLAPGTGPQSTRAASATTSSATARGAVGRATPSARARWEARASAARASSLTRAAEPRPRRRCRSTADSPPPPRNRAIQRTRERKRRRVCRRRRALKSARTCLVHVAVRGGLAYGSGGGNLGCLLLRTAIYSIDRAGSTIPSRQGFL